jgi:hypothetical protein
MRHGIKTTRHGTIFAVSRTLDREQHRRIEAVFCLWAIEPYGEDSARLSCHDDRFRRQRRGRLGRRLHLRLSEGCTGDAGGNSGRAGVRAEEIAAVDVPA